MYNKCKVWHRIFSELKRVPRSCPSKAFAEFVTVIQLVLWLVCLQIKTQEMNLNIFLHIWTKKWFFLPLPVLSSSASEYTLNITSDSPIAIGTSVIFNVTLLEDGKLAPNNKYMFRYRFLRSEGSKETHSPSEVFVINTEELDHGHYEITFYVDEFVIFVYYEKARAKTTFNITNRFNGVMLLVQNPNDTVRENGYVSSQSETIHNIMISDKDKKLFDKASYIRVFWFIDCLYLGKTFYFLCLII